MLSRESYPTGLKAPLGRSQHLSGVWKARMGSNSLKNKQSDCDVSATHTGLRPADFPLRSVESRAAARALIQRLSDQRDPRDGDVIVCIPSLDSPVASEIFRQATHLGTAPITDAESRIWIKLPTGLIREEGPETYK